MNPLMANVSLMTFCYSKRVAETEKRANSVQIKNGLFAIRSFSTNYTGKMHAWKACSRQNWLAGSNPVLSAEI